MLSLILWFIYQKCHYSFRNHIINCLSNSPKVWNNKIFDYCCLHVCPWWALAWVTIWSSLELYHSGHMNRLNIFLHVFIYFITMKIVCSFVLLNLRCWILLWIYKLIVICLQCFINIQLLCLLFLWRNYWFLLIKLINIFN